MLAAANEHSSDIYPPIKEETQETLRYEYLISLLTQRCLFAGYANNVSHTVALAALVFAVGQRY